MSALPPNADITEHSLIATKKLTLARRVGTRRREISGTHRHLLPGEKPATFAALDSPVRRSDALPLCVGDAVSRARKSAMPQSFKKVLSPFKNCLFVLSSPNCVDLPCISPLNLKSKSGSCWSSPSSQILPLSSWQRFRSAPIAASAAGSHVACPVKDA